MHKFINYMAYFPEINTEIPLSINLVVIRKEYVY